MSNMFISGIASGIDWNGMMNQIIENARRPALVQLERRDTLERRRSLFDEFLVSLRNFQSTLAPLRLNSTFMAKDLVPNRLDSNASYRGVLNATVSADAEVGVHDLQVLQLARNQVQRSSILTAGNIASVSGKHFYINAKGQNVRVDLTPPVTTPPTTLTAQHIVDRINTALRTNVPPVGVTAVLIPDGSGNRISLRSDGVGLGVTGMVSEPALMNSSNRNVVEFSTNPGNPTADTFTVNFDLGGVNNGAITVRSVHNNTTTYHVHGRDFDIINGNEIRWRQQQFNHPTPDSSFRMTYRADGSETLTISANRAISGNIDRGALSSINTKDDFDPLRVSVWTTSGAHEFIQDVDYTIQGQDIVWLEGGRRPGAGVEYRILYDVAANEDFFKYIQRNNVDTFVPPVTFASLTDEHRTIQVGGRTFQQSTDFEIIRDPNNNTNAAIRWLAYDAPPPGEPYELRSNNGATLVGSSTRESDDVIDLRSYFGDTWTWDPNKVMKIEQNGNVLFERGNPATYPNIEALLPWGGSTGVLRWNSSPPVTPPTLITLPVAGATFTVEYTFNANTFSLYDGGNGVLAALGLYPTNSDNFTAAQDAMIILNGETITSSSNHIGEAHGNELIRGMNIELRGIGHVSLDIEHDAGVAVEAINNFMASYNDVMRWIRTRLTEQSVDQSVQSNLATDDVRWRWGLLRGNPLLRSSNQTMRALTSAVRNPTFTNRTGRNPVFGTFGQNGIASPTSFTVTMGVRHLTVSVNPEDSLQTIVNRINNPNYPEPNGNALFYDPNGNHMRVASARVEDNRIVIQSERADWRVAVGGSSEVLSVLGMTPEYTALSQIGIRLPSTGSAMTEAARAGELEFDTTMFMEAMRNNPEDVAMLLHNFAAEMQTYMDNMVRTSQMEVSPGVTTAQGAVAREMNAIDDQIRSIDRFLTDFERRLAQRQQTIFNQFSAAEVALGRLMQQASWLASVTQQLQAQSVGGGR